MKGFLLSLTGVRSISAGSIFYVQILLGFSYHILSVDQFSEDDFLYTVANVIHSSDPGQLILCFQLLIDALPWPSVLQIN